MFKIKKAISGIQEYRKVENKSIINKYSQDHRAREDKKMIIMTGYKKVICRMVNLKGTINLKMGVSWKWEGQMK